MVPLTGQSWVEGRPAGRRDMADHAAGRHAAGSDGVDARARETHERKASFRAEGKIMPPIPLDQGSWFAVPRPARRPVFRLQRGWLTHNETGMIDRQFEDTLQKACPIAWPVRGNHPQPDDVVIWHPSVDALHVAAEFELCESPVYPVVPAQNARLPGECREEEILWTGLGQPLLFHVGHAAQPES